MKPRTLFAGLLAGRASCTAGKKVRFPSPGDAYSGALRLATITGHPHRAYSCEACGGWHLTRMTTPPKDPR